MCAVVLRAYLLIALTCFFFFKQKTAYEMRISDWSSDVCSSDLAGRWRLRSGIEVDDRTGKATSDGIAAGKGGGDIGGTQPDQFLVRVDPLPLLRGECLGYGDAFDKTYHRQQKRRDRQSSPQLGIEQRHSRSEGHTSELQSLMRTSDAVLCLTQ